MGKICLFLCTILVLILICGIDSCIQDIDSSINISLDAKESNKPLEINNSSINENEPLSYDNYPNVTELHWGHMPITYFIKNPRLCGSNVVEQIKQSFDIIENETSGAVNFEFKEGEGDISVECFDRYDNNVSQLASSRTYADANIWAFNDEAGNVISKGEIRLFKITLGQSYYGRCSSYPDTIIHEILHLFGFQDEDNGGGIMYKYITSCVGKIDQDIIDKLKETYR